MQRRLLAHGSYSTNPVLVDKFVVIPNLLSLWVLEFGDGDFRGGTVGTRCGRDCMVPTDAAATRSRIRGRDWRGRYSMSSLRRHTLGLKGRGFQSEG